MYSTPILFLVFNRPNTTSRVFEQIKKIKPAYLYVAADGPRKENLGEKEVCDEVRKIVLSGIDWECEVKTLFHNENLGCGKAPAEAISWFFNHVNEGIILEDDTLPTNSFFQFCEEMLIRFREVDQIMHVSGNNFQFSNIGSESYYLSKLPHSWGWATWKRAWEKYDFELRDFNEGQINNYFNNPGIDEYWHHIFRSTKMNLYNHVWDYQWFFANFKNNGFSVIPQKNLVSNIGFGAQSTHTTNRKDFLSDLKSYEMDINVGEIILHYEANADINFLKLFGMVEQQNLIGDISAIQAIKLLLKKLKIKYKKRGA